MVRVNFRKNYGIEESRIFQFFKGLGYEHIGSNNKSIMVEDKIIPTEVFVRKTKVGRHHLHLAFGYKYSGNKKYPQIKVFAHFDVIKVIHGHEKHFADRKEKRDIEGYIQRRNWNMKETGTGLSYMIYENGEGELAKNGQIAVVRYEVKLIDGTVCYKTEEGELGKFLVGRSHVETGIHEGITYMRIGDKAKMILPMHLAHGLTGDNEKIPPQSTLFIDIELVDLQNP